MWAAAVFFAQGRDIAIIASAQFSSDLMDQDATAIAPNKALQRRTLAQFGFGLNPQERISLGIGPGDRPIEGMGAGYIAPNQWVDHDQDIDLDGITAQLIMAPGETHDHMVVWLPDQQVLIPGDNWYHAFPNLYAIRGTPYRDFAAWAASLQQLADLQPMVMAPGHTMPVFGAERIQDMLLSTRSAILHIMSHTADGMNAGLCLDDIASSIELPAHIKDRPWLQEFYGRASWAAKAYATGTLGWYDGNPTHLGVLSSQQRAHHMADLAGGVDALRTKAHSTSDLQWLLGTVRYIDRAGRTDGGVKGQHDAQAGRS